MPDLDLDPIVQKVLDLLKADSRTKEINWEKGRFSPHNLRTFPAGAVSLGQGTELGWATAPSGFGGSVVVRVSIWTAMHQGITAAEEKIQDLIGKIYAVLFATVQLDIASYATKPWITTIATQEVISNVEGSPAQAEATLLATYTVRK